MSAIDTSPELNDYLSDRSPTKLNSVLRTLRPVINHALISFGAADDPIVRTKAEALAARAVTRYDPSAGAGLRTWVSGQLMPLARYRRETQSVGIPDRAQLDHMALERARLEFEEERGRPPDMTELADRSGIPVRRIKKVTLMTGKKAIDEGRIEGQATGVDYTDEAVEALIPELDDFGRGVLQFRTGYGGAPILSAQEIAKRYKVSPAAVSKKSAVLMHKFSKILQDFEAVYG
jgi:DNA-directed RNA polymerase specialized sigma subunit